MATRGAKRALSLKCKGWNADELMAASGGKSAPRCGCVLAGDAEVGSDGKLELYDEPCACAFFGGKCVDREQPDIRIRVGA